MTGPCKAWKKVRPFSNLYTAAWKTPVKLASPTFRAPRRIVFVQRLTYLAAAHEAHNLSVLLSDVHLNVLLLEPVQLSGQLQSLNCYVSIAIQSLGGTERLDCRCWLHEKLFSS